MDLVKVHYIHRVAASSNNVPLSNKRNQTVMRMRTEPQGIVVLRHFILDL